MVVYSTVELQHFVSNLYLTLKLDLGSSFCKRFHPLKVNLKGFWSLFMVSSSVADPDLVGSGPFWSDPDLDPGLKK
jgi:hypothetical protein